MLSYRGKGDIDMGFEFTNLQKKANRKLALTKVKYRNMWNGEGELGYTSCGRNCYEINVAQDAPSEEVKAVVLKSVTYTMVTMTWTTRRSSRP